MGYRGASPEYLDVNRWSITDGAPLMGVQDPLAANVVVIDHGVDAAIEQISAVLRQRNHIVVGEEDDFRDSLK